MPYTLAWRLRLFILLAWPLLAIGNPLGADESSRNDATLLEPRLIHLRNGTVREWAEFPTQPPGETWETRFVAVKNEREATLRWRQQDVKQTWRVLLNGKPLTQLVADEQDLAICRPVPAGALLTGENLLRIESAARGAPAPDDIRVGQWELIDRPLDDLLHEATLELQVVDEETRAPLPARMTIVAASGALPSIGAVSNERLAVRPGVIYSAAGPVKIGLPSGRYTIYAGRGFEYSLAKVEVELKAGAALARTLTIRREVPTTGYLACDPHIHTLTHSGHGDATLDERMLTLAGEGIELPIATDHNIAIDFEASAQRMKVRPYFTPVVGNEFTTALGHFNVFPLSKTTPLPDPQRGDWPALFDEIFRTPGVKVAILNHARDLHRGTRPFGPQLYNAVVAEQLDGWPLRFNAMEVVNSGATQTAARQLIHDWFGLLNRGQRVTPIGSSDSHDVARYIVGQGRTYIRGDDRDVGRIDVEAAMNNLLQGRVLVSYGLLTELTVDEKYGPGEFAAPVGDEVSIKVRVLGPHWT
ncbi:MAG TPA: CehA/McbA family metallohydrolase, partial [Pirellulaceae bacterium]|nr:CehA/McbA family metallohydrolase [Pirellulaceae bacterium]